MQYDDSITGEDLERMRNEVDRQKQIKLTRQALLKRRKPPRKVSMKKSEQQKEPTPTSSQELMQVQPTTLFTYGFRGEKIKVQTIEVDSLPKCFKSVRAKVEKGFKQQVVVPSPR